MTARSSMTMRAYIERNDATGEDENGQPVAANFVAHSTVACRAWNTRMEEIVETSGVAVIHGVRAVMPLATDITSDDQVTNIVDRRGSVLFAGPFLVDGEVIRREDHVAVTLRRAR